MLRSIFFTSLASTLLAGVAYADSYADNQIDLQEPTVAVRPLPDSHADHARCHAVSKFLDSDPYCGPIRTAERKTYKNTVSSQPVTEVVLPDGSRKQGARTLFSQSSVVQIFNTESTWSSMAWLTRFKIPSTDYASSQPTYENASIDSCNEYVYQRYYGANRYLDTLGQFQTQRRYDKALDAIAYGIPAVNGTKHQLPLNGFPLVDYNYRAIAPYTPGFTAAPHPAIAPLKTGTQVRNPFYAMPTMVAAVEDDGSVEWDELQAAYAKSLVNPTTTYPSSGEFGYAQQMRAHPDIVNLSAADRDDIARRVKAMRDALGSALRGFGRCVTKDFFRKSASANFLTAKSTLQIREYLEEHPLDEGFNDPNPIDQIEIDLATQLLDSSTTASDALSKLLAADPKGTGLYARWARTRTGTLLRLLHLYDAAAMQNAVTYTRSTFKSGTFDTTGGCHLSEDFAQVRELLIAEYRRGEAGCMATSRRCDFSAPVFVEDVYARVSQVIEDIDEAKAQCIAIAGSTSFGTQVPVNVRDSVVNFEKHLATKYAELRELLKEAPRGSTLTEAIGDRRDGGSSWGHPGTSAEPGSFGAGYTYASEWGVNVIQRTETGDACRLGGKAEGRLFAFATAFGQFQSLVDARLSATTAQPNRYSPKTVDPAQFSAKVALLGKDVFTPIASQTIQDGYHTDAKGSQHIEIIKTTILVGFVPVSLSVGFQFDYGFDLDLDFTQSGCVPLTSTSGPSLALTGVVTPRAGASATVSAYIDLFVVGAGVKGRLTLVEARLPFSSSVKSTFNATKGLEITAESSLNLILTELSGGLSFFVSLVGITVWEHEFFSWPGITQTVRLWNHSETYPGAAFNFLKD